MESSYQCMDSKVNESKSINFDVLESVSLYQATLDRVFTLHENKEIVSLIRDKNDERKK